MRTRRYLLPMTNVNGGDIKVSVTVEDACPSNREMVDRGMPRSCHSFCHLLSISLKLYSIS